MFYLLETYLVGISDGIVATIKLIHKNRGKVRPTTEAVQLEKLISFSDFTAALDERFGMVALRLSTEHDPRVELKLGRIDGLRIAARELSQHARVYVRETIRTQVDLFDVGVESSTTAQAERALPYHRYAIVVQEHPLQRLLVRLAVEREVVYSPDRMCLRGQV